MISARIVFLLAMAAGAAMAQGPRLFYTDLDSGPNNGGERNQGAFVTLYGRNFGAERGTSRVTFGSGEPSYVSWADSKIVVQLGPNVTSGDVRVLTSGGASNAITFTVRAGNIFAVATNGADTNSGAFGTPWRTVQKAIDTMAPGDITYLLDGVVETRTSSRQGSVFISRNDGEFGRPKALIGYPGARARIGATASSTCNTDSCIEGVRSGFASAHWTIANLQLFGNNYGIVIRGRNWRVIGNEFTCPFGTGASACVDASQAELIKLWGNVVRDVGFNGSSALYHGVYFSTDSNDLDIGWNSISNVRGCRGIQINSTNVGAGTGNNQFNIRIHDNLIEGTQCDGIVLSTVDPSRGPVEVYNNVIVDAGRGPATPEGGGNFACLYAAGFTNAGAPGSGTIEVFHNTMVDCGGFNASTSSSGGVMLAQRATNLRMRLRNNIIYNRRSQYFGVFGSDGRACHTTCENLFGSNNLFFGVGAPHANPVFMSSLNVDPLFVSFERRDYRLRANSPARGAGVNTGAGTDREGTIRTTVIDLGAFQSSGSSIVAPPALTATPASIEATASAGGEPPARRQITLSNNTQAAVEWTAASDQRWLVLGTRQGTIQPNTSLGFIVSFNIEGLAPGVYTGKVTIQAGEGQSEVPVQLTISALAATGPALWTSSATVTLTADPGANPPDQVLRIANFGAAGSTLRWTASVDQGWLRVSPTSGTLAQGASANLTLSATSPARIGLFNGVLTLTVEGGAPVTIPVRLALGAPRINAIVNAASLQQNSFSPRAIVTLFGQDIGPEEPVGLRLTDDNRAVAATGGDVVVLFGDTPAPILYASANQVNAVVPSAAGLSRTAAVRVEYLTRRSDPVTIPIAITSPAIFTVTGTGRGAGAILNQNNALNTDETPAAAGSAIAIYLTGLGELDRPGGGAVLDGEVVLGADLRIRNATQVTVGGRTADVLYVGAAPGFIAGVFQVNVRIPTGLAPGRYPVRITSAGIVSSDAVTVAVR
jgi:uncharacterized protein (TIGR03437 family)